LLTLSNQQNQQSNTSEILHKDPFPQCDGMVRWSMLSNRKVVTSITLITGELAV
jgi:hypothetical protein